ncbi:MAG: polysaccharide biosynthesis protein [Clostridiaceae bacterium]|jgi:stage V sporulation protein B|nr:polysaccharide biosynthesis protein [Clostridiaceae bacterium]
MKEQSTTKGFAILSAAGMIVKILSLLYIPFLIAIITDGGYGIYGAAYQVYVFIYVLTNSGIPVAISKLISELTALGNYKDAVKSFKIARFMLLILGTIMTIIMLIFAKSFANITNPKAYYAILALAPCVLFTSIASAYRGYFQGRGYMTPTAVSQIIEQTINTIFTLVFAALLIRFGVEAGCAGGTIGSTLGALSSVVYLILFYERNKRIKIHGKISNTEIRRLTNKQIVKKIIHYGIPITLSVGLTYAGNLVDLWNTMSRLSVAGISSWQASILYGYLLKYTQLMNVPIALITSLSAAILPAIAGAAVIRDRNKVREKVNYAFRLSLLISIPSAFGLGVLSDPIYKLLAFRGGSNIMKIGSIVLVLMAVMQIQITILQSLGKLYTATLYSFIGIVFKIAANYFLIAVPNINILGAVFGSIIGYLIPVILNHRMIKKTLRVRFSLLFHGYKPLISSLLMSLSVYIVYYNLIYIMGFINKGYLANAISTITAVIVGMFTYLFALILTGGIRKSDINGLPGKITRIIPKFMYIRIR